MQIIERKFPTWKLPDVEPNKVIIGFDTEYESNSRNRIPIGKQLVAVNQRHLEDIISIQLGLNYMNMEPTLYMLHREHNDPVFQFSDVIDLTRMYLKKIGMLKTIQQRKRTFTLEFWAFWAGVDLSVFKDYEKVLTENMPKNTNKTGKVVTVGGNTAFTSRPIKLKVRDRSRNLVHVSAKDRLVVRDTIKLAPSKFNLARLGDLINIPKLDTEQWDEEDGLQVGYYKSHMSELWKHRQNDFIDYALEDVVVTVQYGTFVLNFQKQLMEKGFGNFKPGQLKTSLGSIIANIVNQENKKESQWIVTEVIKLIDKMKQNSKSSNNLRNNIEKLLRTIVSPDVVTKTGKVIYDYHFNELPTDLSVKKLQIWLTRYLDFDKIRKGYRFPRNDISRDEHHKHLINDIKNRIDLPQNNMFLDAVAAYYGGYNMVLKSGILPSGKEKRDWDISSAYSEAGHLIPDIAPGLGVLGDTDFSKFNNLRSDQFDKVVNFANKISGPYTVGIGIFDVEYPHGYKGFTITPQNVDKTPRYFRSIHQVPLSYTDAYTAWRCGAKVFTHRLSFVAQAKIEPGTLKGVCAEGHIQDIFQKRRESCKHGSPHDVMYKNIVNQAYGVTAEGLKQKRSKDYNNGRPYYIPFSQITNPLKAMQFTAITRLHIITLQRAILRVDSNATFPNNVTDGCLTWTTEPLNIEEIIDALDEITEQENLWYHDMVHSFFNGKYIKKKDGTTDDTANLRTRLTFSRDNNLKAMVGISQMTPAEVFQGYIDQFKPYINEINRQITGINEMRHVKKFQHFQTTWEQPVNLYFSYDMAQVPTDYHQTGDYVYWDTRPYYSKEEFERINTPARNLMKYGCWYSADDASYFKRSLHEIIAGYKPIVKFWRADKGDWKNGDYQHKGVEVYRNWVCYVARNNLNLTESYRLIQDKFHEMDWSYLRGSVERDLPQEQSFKSVVRRIQKSSTRKLLVNYVLLHNNQLIWKEIYLYE